MGYQRKTPLPRHLTNRLRSCDCLNRLRISRGILRRLLLPDPSENAAARTNQPATAASQAAPSKRSIYAGLSGRVFAGLSGAFVFSVRRLAGFFGKRAGGAARFDPGSAGLSGGVFAGQTGASGFPVCRLICEYSPPGPLRIRPIFSMR